MCIAQCNIGLAGWKSVRIEEKPIIIIGWKIYRILLLFYDNWSICGFIYLYATEADLEAEKRKFAASSLRTFLKLCPHKGFNCLVSVHTFELAICPFGSICFFFFYSLKHLFWFEPCLSTHISTTHEARRWMCLLACAHTKCDSFTIDTQTHTSIGIALATPLNACLSIRFISLQLL